MIAAMIGNETDLMTADELLDALHLHPPTKATRAVVLHRLREKGLRAIKVGKAYTYTREAVRDFIRSQEVGCESLLRLSQCALVLRMDVNWLAKQIEEGGLPGVISRDGHYYADPRQLRDGVAALSRKGRG